MVNKWTELPLEYILYICGEGECETEIVNISKNHSNIVYLGYVSHEIIVSKMKQCMALITPYKWYEGFPMNIIESFSVGCPVLTSNIGNAENIVSISNGGVSFDFNKEKSFENAIEECIDNNRALSINAYQYYRNVLMKEKNYEALNTIYTKSKVGGEIN